jgi:hypothetical protein
MKGELLMGEMVLHRRGEGMGSMPACHSSSDGKERPGNGNRYRIRSDLTMYGALYILITYAHAGTLHCKNWEMYVSAQFASSKAEKHRTNHYSSPGCLDKHLEWI